MGHPQKPRLNFEVTYLSGIIHGSAANHGNHRHERKVGPPAYRDQNWTMNEMKTARLNEAYRKFADGDRVEALHELQELTRAITEA